MDKKWTPLFLIDIFNNFFIGLRTIEFYLSGLKMSEKKNEEKGSSSGIVKEGVIQYSESRTICSYCGEEIKSNEKITKCPYCNTPLSNDSSENE
jgi:rubrerythrin